MQGRSKIILSSLLCISVTFCFFYKLFSQLKNRQSGKLPMGVYPPKAGGYSFLLGWFSDRYASMKTSVTFMTSSLMRVSRLNPTDSVCQVIDRAFKAGSRGSSTI